MCVFSSAVGVFVVNVAFLHCGLMMSTDRWSGTMTELLRAVWYGESHKLFCHSVKVVLNNKQQARD